MSLTMESAIEYIKQTASQADELGRTAIIDELRDLSYSLESSQDAMHRILRQPLQLLVARVGCDLKLYDILAQSENPMTVSEVAERTGVAPLLMGRLLRFLASVRQIQETAKDTFTANALTKTLTHPGWRGSVYHIFDACGPAFQAFPEFLKTTKYQDVDDPANCPLQAGWHTDLPGFAWYPTKPELFAHFNQYMVVHYASMGNWFSTYPYQDRVDGLKPDQPFFVDIGGGLGHQAIGIRERLPDLSNKVILQDIPATLQHAIPHPGIKVMVQDFWQPQQVKGARIYYMRNIIHDYPDEKAVTLLKNTKDALGPDSVILIDDMVLPDQNAHWHATSIDFEVMCGLAALERTREQWFALIDRAGLKIRQIYTYTQTLQTSIIECVSA